MSKRLGGIIGVGSHIQRTVLATEETTMTQRVSHRPIKCQSRSWSQRGTKVKGSHHADHTLLKPTGIQIATKYLPGLTTRQHRKLIGVKTTMSLGTNYSFFCCITVSGMLPVFHNLDYKRAVYCTVEKTI